jgi:hypothetical protein
MARELNGKVRKKSVILPKVVPRILANYHTEVVEKDGDVWKTSGSAVCHFSKLDWFHAVGLGGSVTVPDTLHAMKNRDWNRKGRFRGLVKGSFLNGPRIMILQQVWNRWPERRNIRKMQFIAVRNHLL